MSTSESGVRRSIRVLVVDDVLRFHEEVQRFAELLKCEVRFVTNLTAAALELSQWEPDAVLLDLHLPSDRWRPSSPVKQKYEPTQKSLAFCEQIKSDPRYSGVFVVFVSLDRQREQVLFARNAGADGFFNKGDFSVEKFERILKRTRARAKRKVNRNPKSGT